MEPAATDIYPVSAQGAIAPATHGPGSTSRQISPEAGASCRERPLARSSATPLNADGPTRGGALGGGRCAQPNEHRAATRSLSQRGHFKIAGMSTSGATSALTDGGRRKRDLVAHAGSSGLPN